MGRKLIAVVCFCLLCFPKDSSSIGAGWPALEREFQSAVQIWTMEDNKPKYLCSGVAIAPDTVITTASCPYAANEGVKETLFISTTQKIDFKAPLAQAIQTVSSLAKRGIKDPGNNLMLIFLKQPLNVEPAILLSTSETFQIHLLGPVFFAGFGERDDSTTASGARESWWEFLGYANKSIESGEKIIAKSRIASVAATELKVGSLAEDGFACPGDEGAPLYAHIDTPFSNSQRVIGITMQPNTLKHCSKPTTVLRLDAFRDFINDKMIQECRAGSRSWCQVEGLLPPGHNEEMIREKKPPVDEKAAAAEPPSETVNPPVKQLPPEITPAQGIDKTPGTKTPSQFPQRASKRRITVNAEGAGCSCQQVFTSRP